MGTESHGKTPRDSDAVGDDRRCNLVQLDATVLLWHIYTQQAKLARLAHQSAAYLKVLGFNLCNLGGNSVLCELGRCLRYLSLLEREILWRKDIIGRKVFNQETASGHSLCLNHCCNCTHRPLLA